MPTPEEKIAELLPHFTFHGPHGCGLAFSDPAVNHAIELADPPVRNQLLAVSLETNAAAFRAIADGAEKAARIIKGQTDA